MPVDHGPLSELPLARYRPYSRLRLPRTTVTRASAPKCFAYSPDDPPKTGRWHISALDLPEGVLRQVYADNAMRLIPALAAAGEPAAP